MDEWMDGWTEARKDHRREDDDDRRGRGATRTCERRRFPVSSLLQLDELVLLLLVRSQQLSTGRLPITCSAFERLVNG